MLSSAIIIEDHHLMNDSIAWILSESSLNFSYIPVCSITKAIQILHDHTVDLIIVNLKLPEHEIRNFVKYIKTHWQGIKIIIISSDSRRTVIKKLVNSGAEGLILKNNLTGEIACAVNEILEGNKYFGKDINNIINGLKVKYYPTLTNREKEVLQLIAKGHTNPEISKMLFISHFTVDSHRKNLLNKFSTPNTAALIKSALMMGIIES